MPKEDIPTWVRVAIAVVLFAFAVGTTVGGITWAMSKDSTSHDFVVESLLKTDQRHDKLISQNADDISSVKEEQHKSELARTRLEGKIDVSIVSQQATTRELTEIRKDFKELTKFLMQFDYDKEKDTE